MWRALPACAALALALPAGLPGGNPARRRRFPAPRRARSAGTAALAPPMRAAVQIAAPQGRGARLGQGPGQGPQTSAPKPAAPARRRESPRGAAAATPGGECAGRPPIARARRRRGRSQGGGRSAADRAGGADGPTAPTEWGPGRPGAPTPQPARGRSNARPGHRPAPQGLGLALRRGAPAQRLAANLTGPGPAGARPWPPHVPGPAGDGAGGGTAAAQGGQGGGPQAAGAGGTRPTAGGADGSPFPQAGCHYRHKKRGSAHRALPLLLPINCRCSSRKVCNTLCSRLGKSSVWQASTGGTLLQGLCPCTPLSAPDSPGCLGAGQTGPTPSSAHLS